MSRSKEKGGAAEREVALALQEWWRRKEGAAEFFRTPQSGAMRGTKRDHFKAHGDISCSVDSFPFTVEVKRREGYSPHSFLKRIPSSPVWDWWRQAQADAISAKGVPLLVFRKNRSPWMCWVPVGTMIGHRTDHGTVLQGLMQEIAKPGDDLFFFKREQLLSVDYGHYAPMMFPLAWLTSQDPAVIQSATC